MASPNTLFDHSFSRMKHFLCIAGALTLAGCAGAGNQSIDNTFVSGIVDPFEPELSGPLLRGAVAGDEPRAVMVGRDILSSGGTAGDAAAAMYFALAVTKPSAASLGGGGVCVAYNLKSKQADTIAFPAIPVGNGFAGLPGNVKGISLLQARHGQLPWGHIVAPAERMARQGIRISGEEAALADQGHVSPKLQAGQQDDQLALSATLSSIRTKGPKGFYSGPVGRQVVEALRAAGSDVTEADLRNYSALLYDTEVLEVGDMLLHYPSRQYAGGGQAQALTELAGNETFWSVPADQRDRQVRETLQASSVRAGAADKAGTTSFAAIDAGGNAVSCAVSMNAPFGTGKRDRITGIYPSSVSTLDGASEWTTLLPLLAVNGNTGKFYYTGVAAGGLEGTAKSITLALGSVITDDGTLETAFGAASKAARGSAIYCRYGLTGDTRSCRVKADGYAIAVPQ